MDCSANADMLERVCCLAGSWFHIKHRRYAPHVALTLRFAAWLYGVAQARLAVLRRRVLEEHSALELRNWPHSAARAGANAGLDRLASLVDQ